MNIREAILKAADHIGRNPNEFQFWSITTPEHPGCGTPGCALGWIGTFCGLRHVGPIAVAQRALGLVNENGWDHAKVFYDRMRAIPEARGWSDSAAVCSRALRLYADKYHPAAPLRFPDWQAMAATQTVGTDAVSEDARVCT